MASSETLAELLEFAKSAGLNFAPQMKEPHEVGSVLSVFQTTVGHLTDRELADAMVLHVKTSKNWPTPADILECARQIRQNEAAAAPVPALEDSHAESGDPGKRVLTPQEFQAFREKIRKNMENVGIDPDLRKEDTQAKFERCKEVLDKIHLELAQPGKHGDPAHPDCEAWLDRKVVVQ